MKRINTIIIIIIIIIIKHPYFIEPDVKRSPTYERHITEVQEQSDKSCNIDKTQLITILSKPVVQG